MLRATEELLSSVLLICTLCIRCVGGGGKGRGSQGCGGEGRGDELLRAPKELLRAPLHLPA